MFDIPSLLITSSASLWRILLIGPVIYLTLIVVLRVTGKRTLSKLNVFDFVITIALGSTVATIVLSEEIDLAEGILTLILLSLLQFIITFISVRVPWFKDLVTDQPTLVFHRGKYLHQNMRQVRITQSEILQAIRNQGIGSIKRVDAVVLETNGDLNVIKNLSEGNHTTLSVINQ